MDKTNKKGKLYCLISALIIVGSYALQRIIALTIAPSKTLVLAEAIAFTIAVCIVYFLVVKSNESFYGILTAVLGFRMLPPNISALAQFSPQGEIVYYLVGRFSVLLFAFAIIKLYDKQGRPRQIKPVPILCLLFAVPFAMEVADRLSAFAYENIAPTMLYPYFISFAFYSIVYLVMFCYAARCNPVSAQLITDYSIVALCVNAARRLAVVIIYLAKGYHVSKSYYCWIAIYIFFMVIFFLLRKKKCQTQSN